MCVCVGGGDWLESSCCPSCQERDRDNVPLTGHWAFLLFSFLSMEGKRMGLPHQSAPLQAQWTSQGAFLPRRSPSQNQAQLCQSFGNTCGLSYLSQPQMSLTPPAAQVVGAHPDGMGLTSTCKLVSEHSQLRLRVFIWGGGPGMLERQPFAEDARGVGGKGPSYLISEGGTALSCVLPSLSQRCQWESCPQWSPSQKKHPATCVGLPPFPDSLPRSPEWPPGITPKLTTWT